MFGSLAPDVTAHDVQELARATVALYTPGASPGSKLGRAAPIAESASRPWDQGYELAEEVHERFDGAFERDDCVDVKALSARRSHRDAGAVG